MNYSIHNIIKIRSNVKLPLSDYFLRSNVRNPDLTVLKEKLDVEKPRGYELRRINYYYWCEERKLFIDYKFANSKLILENLLGNTKIKFTPGFYRYSAQETLDFMLARILFIKLIQKGYTFLHAGCVSRDGKGILITAMPDMGKTSTVLSLVGKGFSFLGDDHVILSEDGTIYSYPKKMTISPETLTGGIVHNLPLYKRALVKIRPLKIVAEKFFGSVAEPREVPRNLLEDRSKVSLAFMLAGGGNEIRPVNKEKLMNMMLLPLPAMDGFPDSFADLYLYLNGVCFGRIVGQGGKIMRKGLKRVKCFEVMASSIKGYSELIGEKIKQMV